MNRSIVSLLLGAAAAFSLPARGQVYEKVFSFTQARTSLRSPSALVQVRSGTLFGFGDGGRNGHGTIFKVNADRTLTTLVEFTDNGATNRGATPISLIEGADGNLYGTTYFGGAFRNSSDFGYGTVFRVTPDGVLTTLAEFAQTGGDNRGSAPYFLVHGLDGNFYGGTLGGGNHFSGTLFRITPSGSLTTLIDFTFDGATNRGTGPTSLVQGSDGFFYGTTLVGGANDKGTVFRWAPGSPVTTLHEFSGIDGELPTTAMVETAGGEFYGTTREGGANGFGTVFRLRTTPSVAFEKLLDFTGTEPGARGGSPGSPLVAGPDGALYGVTPSGGNFDHGTLFRLTTSGVHTPLVDFTGDTGDYPGSGPGRIIQGSDGVFRGSTGSGGASDAGTIFTVTTQGDFKSEVEFVGGARLGRQPYGGLTQHPDGNLYGTTRTGGNANRGTIFKMTPEGEVTTVGHFGTGGDLVGKGPVSSIVYANNGYLFGTTSGEEQADGTIFAVAPGGVPTTIVQNMRGPSGLSLAANGLMYGTMTDRPAGFFEPLPTGRIFSLSEFFQYANVVIFPGDGSNTGTIPLAGVTRDGTELWGTTSEGGTNGLGTVYSYTAGLMTTVANFTGTTGSGLGSKALARLIKSGAQTFLGVTSRGGTNDRGTIFRVQRGVSGLTTLINFTGVGNIGASQTFSNSAVVTLNDRAIASPYPSTINVPAGIDAIGRVRVTLNGFEHTYPSDARFVLLSPTGQSCLLMADAGGGFSVSGVTLTFDDNASGTVPSPITGGSHRPTPNGFEGTHITTDFMAFAQIPPFPPYGTQLSVFQGQPATGVWSLYAVDTQSFDTGRLAGGWTLEISPVIPGGTNVGSEPAGALVQASDGNFYGTTSKGGTNNLGTIFKLSPEGVLTTLHEFRSYDAKDSGPYGDLMLGSDGNIYGTAAGNDGGDGSIFRIVIPGAPGVVALAAADRRSRQARLRCSLNPRGGITAATVEYGRTSSASDASKPVAANQTGYATRQLSALLTDLDPASVYYYRFRAVNSAGTTYFPPLSDPPLTFSTLSAPEVSVGAASEVASTSAKFNGSVNARGEVTNVTFEWGTDGNSFPNTIAAEPGTVSENVDTPVNAAVADLPAGGTVYYRLRATSAGGTVTSGVRSFATVDLTTSNEQPGDFGVTEATFRATVNTFGRPAYVRFKYWEASEPSVILQTQGRSFTSNGAVPFAEPVSGLVENRTYQYRVSVEIDGVITDDTGTGSGATQLNGAPVPDPAEYAVFFARQIEFPGLENFSDPNGDAMTIDTQLVAPPNVALGTASVTDDRRSINYRPQNNLAEEDELVYRVRDARGLSHPTGSTARVRLLSFRKYDGFYNGTGQEGEEILSLSFNLTSGGALSGRMDWRDGQFKFADGFDRFGRFTATQQFDPRERDDDHIVVLTLAINPDTSRIEGSFTERDNGAIVAGPMPIVMVKDGATGGLAESGLRTGFLLAPEEVAVIDGERALAEGYVRMTIGKDARRGARFAGRLPDGEPFLFSAKAEGRAYIIARKLEQRGLFTGLVRALDSGQRARGMLGNLSWEKTKNTRGKYLRGGVKTMLSLVGVSYPAIAPGGLPPIGLSASTPNARLRLIGGGVEGYRDLLFHVSPGQRKAVNVQSDFTQTGLDLPLTKFQLEVDGANAAFRGKFLHPQSGKLVPFDGTFRTPLFDGSPAGADDLQSAQGRGIFRGPSAAGSVRIEGNVAP